MAEYIYDVRFYTKENNHFYIYRTDIRANNKKHAIRIARELWAENHKAYQFHICAKRRNDVTLPLGLTLPTLGHFKLMDYGKYIPYTKTLNWDYMTPLYFG